MEEEDPAPGDPPSAAPRAPPPPLIELNALTSNYANIDALIPNASNPPLGPHGPLSDGPANSEGLAVDSPSSYHTADNPTISTGGESSSNPARDGPPSAGGPNEDPTTTSSDPTIAEDATIDVTPPGGTGDTSTLNETRALANLEDDVTTNGEDVLGPEERAPLDGPGGDLAPTHLKQPVQPKVPPAAAPSSHERRFFCREWAWAKLWACIEQRPSAKTCGVLIVGGPGTGKTALCTQLVSPTGGHGRHATLLQSRLLAHHFCHAHEAASLAVPAFIQSLVVQLAESPLLTGYATKVAVEEVVQALGPAALRRAPDEAFRRAVLFPLLEVEAPERTLILLVDSVDEDSLLTYGGVGGGSAPPAKGDDSSKTILELLSNHHHLLPQWLLLVITARRGLHSRGLARSFSGFRKIALDDLRRSHVVRDVQQYILCRLDTEPALRHHLSRETAEMLNQLHIKSNGCFLYLQKVLDGVVEGWVTLREIRDIPGTLNGLYLWLCQRLYPRKHFQRVLPLLSVILASRAPLTPTEVRQAVSTHVPGLTEEEWAKRWALLRRVLCPYTPDVLLLFHHSFAEWLLDVKHCTQKYLVGVSEGHGMLAMKMTLEAPLLTPQEVQTFAFHLARVPLKPPLQSFHLPLWALSAGAPVQSCFQEVGLTDTLSFKLLQEAGAKVGLAGGPVEEEEDEEDEEEDEEEEEFDEGGPVDGTDAAGRTLLHTAAHQGDASLVGVLLQRGATHGLTDRGGQTPLNLAARHGHADVVTSVLAYGANPDHADDDGWTSLRSAAWAGHVGVVEALLKGGAQADLADGDGRTALRAAAWGGHEDVVATLLASGADVNRADSEGRTPLIAAAYMGHCEIVTSLIAGGADVNHADKDGRSALSVGALCVTSLGRLQVVTALLDGGADVDHEDKDGLTPLLVAAFEGHVDVCELLLEYEADVDHVDRSGRTPLLAAASMGHAAVVERLLFWGCYVDHIDVEGRTVLSVAAAQGSQETVRLLLERGLDETHRDNAGWTPLHYASFEGHTGVCEALVEGGERRSRVKRGGTNDGTTPLVRQAQERATPTCVRPCDAARLPHEPERGRSALRVAASEATRTWPASAGGRGADLRTTRRGRAARRCTCWRWRTAQMAAFLLERRADCEARTGGVNPLHVTVMQGATPHACEVLLSGGAGGRGGHTSTRRRPLAEARPAGTTPGIVSGIRCTRAHAATAARRPTALYDPAQEGRHQDMRGLRSRFEANAASPTAAACNRIKVRSRRHHSLARHSSRPPGAQQHASPRGKATRHSAGGRRRRRSRAPSLPLPRPRLPFSPPPSTRVHLEKRRSCLYPSGHSLGGTPSSTSPLPNLRSPSNRSSGGAAAGPGSMGPAPSAR
ncbi:UNVERIFIED_CONTAM: hypothetical protein GTU68_052051 [Idotea baltica]|nr:hypothetical protein [Idotea baltica]